MIFIAIGACMLLSLLLIIAEALLPGFGLPGITGGLLAAAGIGMTYKASGSAAALGLLLVFAVLIALIICLILRRAQEGKMTKMFLTDTEDLEEKKDLSALVGKCGTATSALRPAGIGDFDGVRLNVVTEGDFIQKDEKIRIIRAESAKLIVKRIDNEEEK